MFKVSRFVVFTLIVLSTAAAGAQTRDDGRDRPWGIWVRGQGQQYQNFFQAPEGSEEQDVSALLGEIGASFEVGRDLSVYGLVNTLRYDQDELDASNGIRVGLRRQGRPHSFDVYAEQLQDRPSFDVGDEFDRADIRTVAGEYALRVGDDWQISVDGELQQQQFEVTPARDNDFGAFGGAVRWRGSRLFSPEIGVRFGERDVDDETLSYDQRDLYLQIRSSITPDLYVSLRYRDRSREYSTGLVTSTNFGREDERKQIALGTDWTFIPSLTLNLYAARETVDVNLAGRDFDTALYAAGLTWRY